MSIEKMREEFERTNGRDHRRQPPKGNNYIDPMGQADWESFQKGWNQSREALAIELPTSLPSGDYRMTVPFYKAADVHEALSAAGIEVKA